MNKNNNENYKLQLLTFSCSLLLLSAACNAPFNQPVTGELKVEAKKTDAFTGQTFEVSNKKGAEIIFRIILPPNDFTTKANTSGQPTKTATDIDHYVVYLIKNTSTTSYPNTGDPLGDIVAGGGPFNINNAVPLSPQNVRFSNVQSSGTDAYYIAVRAQDSSNNDLIRDNNGGTAWTGSTIGTPKVAVSSGNGIVVDNNISVSSVTPLSVTINLIDGKGALIESSIAPNNGTNNLPNGGVTLSKI